MKDVTEKYLFMIQAFECDFAIMKRNSHDCIYFKFKNNDVLLKDIELLNELSFNLRHNKCKIIENEN